MLFFNEKLEGHTPGSKYVVIQEIMKNHIPISIQYLFLQYAKYMPKVNTLLMDPINALAVELNADYIYVTPLRRQGEILQKYYGFKRLESRFKVPCRGLSAANPSSESVGLYSLYKEVNRE